MNLTLEEGAERSVGVSTVSGKLTSSVRDDRDVWKRIGVNGNDSLAGLTDIVKADHNLAVLSKLGTVDSSGRNATSLRFVSVKRTRTGSRTYVEKSLDRRQGKFRDAVDNCVSSGNTFVKAEGTLINHDILERDDVEGLHCMSELVAISSCIAGAPNDSGSVCSLIVSKTRAKVRDTILDQWACAKRTGDWSNDIVGGCLCTRCRSSANWSELIGNWGELTPASTSRSPKEENIITAGRCQMESTKVVNELTWKQ